ncbi:spermatogenesis-associated protein 48 [Eublepharis macularius]|uniref:Spermatogenesis-associated protein 48 n=1 Tax=Eublepharis macularius TaxID=481883 RepID=A0AA97L8F7_EUBMA|nr:spermatogenesis-associated protein 48 [Eublepharis macularius]
MASEVTARQFSPLKRLEPPSNSYYKMTQKQHEGLLKRMYMPFVRGPEDRHYFPSFEDKYSHSFLKSNPYTPPEEKNYPFAPHRDDVPAVNTFSGFVSPGADADQNVSSGTIPESPKGGRDAPLPQQAVPVPHRRAETSCGRPALLLKGLNQDRRWNSRWVPEVSLKAQAAKWINPVKVMPVLPEVKECFSPHTFIFKEDSGAKSSDPSSEACQDEKARKYMYTSATQSGYEDVPWDRMLLPKPQIDPTLEAMTDCVSQCFKLKRYEAAPEISQVAGGLWDRFQTRSFTVPHKPINFVSPSSRTEQIPLYTGHIGAENFDDVDNANVDLIMHGKVRTVKPCYVKSSYALNTSGYTGKVHWSATQPANSNLPPTSPSTISRMHGHMVKQGQPTKFPHLGPLSQLVTPTEPQNSFNKKVKERIKI